MAQIVIVYSGSNSDRVAQIVIVYRAQIVIVYSGSNSDSI